MNVFRAGFVTCLLLALVVLPGLGCRGGSQAAKQEAQKPVVLDVWRVFDNSDTMNDIITAYRAKHPNVTINYRKLRFDEYEDELLRAFAEDRGPDIFSVHNTWMKGYLSLIEPMPDTVKLTYTESRGTIKKEQVVVERTEPTMSLRSLNDDFVQVAVEDVVYPATVDGQTQNRIYGLPMSVDTLALFYNKDLLDAAGIPEPPRTWREFQEQVIKLTKYDARGDVAQSGAAFGTGKNVARSFDIVSLLMMQSGAVMADAKGDATFAQMIRNGGESMSPAVEALRFYTDFANPTKEVYTWDRNFTNSQDAFATGQTAFFFGYSYHIPLITAQSPKLNYGIAHVPQLNDGKVNYANFWIESVSKKSEATDWAWDFVQFATSAEQVEGYLAKAGKPTALRGLILRQLDDARLGVFADQVLSAKDWYNGANATAAEEVFVKMIDDIVAGTVILEEAVKVSEQRINETL